MLHRCAVIEKKKNRYILSLRPSRMGDDVTATDLEITSLTNVTEGAIMRGFVKASSKHGIFVWCVGSRCLYVCVYVCHTCMATHTHHTHTHTHTHTNTDTQLCTHANIHTLTYVH